LRFASWICLVGLCCLLLGACADTAVDGPESYVVHPEDTLYSIAWRHDLDYRDLARWNNIGRDFRISVGQVLVLAPRTQDMLRSETAAPAQAAPRVSKPQALADTQTKPLSSAAPVAAYGGMKWVWPTDRVGSPRPVPGGGILLSGHLGQDVRAASVGRVVYTGSGIRGYGNLIIIKHGDSWLSAYAHNREMLVHDGQEVVMGQVIGHMGQGPNQLPILYFEIRQNGKPVDPVPLLLR
jgi:lipoprotein NlpD